MIFALNGDKITGITGFLRPWSCSSNSARRSSSQQSFAIDPPDGFERRDGLRAVWQEQLPSCVIKTNGI
jgi:hypothetical protein